MNGNTHPVTYRELYEKYAHREKIRAIAALIGGITSAAGVVSAVIILRQLRADRRAVLASAIARDS